MDLRISVHSFSFDLMNLPMFRRLVVILRFIFDRDRLRLLTSQCSGDAVCLIVRSRDMIPRIFAPYIRLGCEEPKAVQCSEPRSSGWIGRCSTQHSP